MDIYRQLIPFCNPTTFLEMGGLSKMGSCLKRGGGLNPSMNYVHGSSRWFVLLEEFFFLKKVISKLNNQHNSRRKSKLSQTVFKKLLAINLVKI